MKNFELVKTKEELYNSLDKSQLVSIIINKNDDFNEAINDAKNCGYDVFEIPINEQNDLLFFMLFEVRCLKKINTYQKIYESFQEKISTIENLPLDVFGKGKHILMYWKWIDVNDDTDDMELVYEIQDEFDDESIELDTKENAINALKFQFKQEVDEFTDWNIEQFDGQKLFYRQYQQNVDFDNFCTDDEYGEFLSDIYNS